MYRNRNKSFWIISKEYSKPKKMTDNDRCTNAEKYVGDIKGGLRPTMKITIMGMIYPSPKSSLMQPGGLQFAKMELLCEHQQIRILLDGRQLCSFSHRVQPVQRMTVLQISGDLKLTKVA
ncbi:hypothetical protein E2320_021209 [Naja naja]|nr:hypothetical protein E2320_021209 [Naja naja]